MTRRLIVCLLLLLAVPITAAAQRDSLQEHVSIGGLTYDDSFGIPLKEPAGIWYHAPTGELFVADAGNGRIIIFDSLLNSLHSFPHAIWDKSTGRSITGQPRAVVVASDHSMLVLDSRSDAIDLLDFRGRLIRRRTVGELIDSTLHMMPIAATISPGDTFFVLVGGDRNLVLVMNAELDLIRQFGESGERKEQFNTPTCIGYLNDQVFVGDVRGLPAIKQFDPSGRFVRGFAAHDIQPPDLSFPSGIIMLNGPRTGPVILVSDALRHVIKLYTPDGEFRTTIGGFGYLPGLLQFPSGLAGNGKDVIFVVERGGGRIQKYDIAAP